MEFKINGSTWRIVNITGNIDDDTGIFGQADYKTHTIKVLSCLPEDEKRTTLIHELAHVYLWEYGLREVREFNLETVCDIVAHSNGFVNEVANKFLKIKK